MNNFSKIQTDDSITCLIAGGGGFIGSYLCEALVSENCYVYCVDNFVTGSRENISQIIQNPNFELINKDLNNLENYSFNRKIDYIFHVAGIEAYINGLNVDIETLSVNSQGTKNLLEIALRHTSKFLLGSSEQIFDQFYQDSDFGQYFGENRQTQGNNIFLEAKKFSEAITVEYSTQKNLDARIVRLGFLYGPKMNLLSGNIISKLLIASLGDKSIEIPNDGMGIIYPTYITDVVRGIIKAMFSQSSKGKIYGLIGNTPITLLQFVQYLQEVLRKNLKIKFGSKTFPGLNMTISQSILKSQESLGWGPEINLSHGLIETINWIKNNNIINNLNIKTNIPAKKAIQSKDVEKITYENKINPKIKNILVKQENHKKPPPSLTIQPSVVNLGLWQRLKLIIYNKLNRKDIKSNKINKKITGFVFALFIFLFIFFSPVLIANLILKNGISQIELVKNTYQTGDIIRIDKNIKNINSNLKILSFLYNIISWQKQIIPIKNIDTIYSYLENTPKLTSIFQDLSKANENVGHIIDIAFNKETTDPQQYFEKMITNLNNARENLDYLKIKKINSKLIDTKNIEILKTQTKQNLNLVNLLPELLSFKDKKTYLILLQDNNELRPTGGFIEGIGLLTVEKGKILDLQIMDVYSVDKLLKGVIVPPEEITKYLGEDEWRLYDSNFSPNFPLSAARASWFVKKELGINDINGVIGLNYNFFKKILDQTDPLFLPEFNESISGSNLIERALRYSEINSFEDTSKNKKMIVNLTTHLYEKIKAMEKSSLVKLSFALYDSLEEKDLMIWFPDSPVESFLKDSNWDGSLKLPPTQLIGFENIDNQDFLGIFSSNFGFNKTNYNIDENVKENILINEDGTITHKVLLSIKNESTTESWPGGTYKNYLRFYITLENIINSLKIGKNSQTLTMEDVKIEDIIIKDEDNHRSIGVFIEVPPLQTREIELTFTSAKKFPTKNNFANYLLYFQKQSGSKNTPYQITLTYPNFFNVKKISEEGIVMSGQTSFSGSLNKDKVFAISFSR